LIVLKRYATDTIKLDERAFLPSGGIQTWPFLTMHPMSFPPFSANALRTPFHPRISRSHEQTHPGRQTNDAWNKRKTTTAFVFCPCWHAWNSTTLPVARLSRGREQKNIVAGFLSRLAKRFCLMVRATREFSKGCFKQTMMAHSDAEE